jgi:flagellar biosynthesis GTPase FlhF
VISWFQNLRSNVTCAASRWSSTVVDLADSILLAAEVAAVKAKHGGGGRYATLHIRRTDSTYMCDSPPERVVEYVSCEASYATAEGDEEAEEEEEEEEEEEKEEKEEKEEEKEEDVEDEESSTGKQSEDSSEEAADASSITPRSSGTSGNTLDDAVLLWFTDETAGASIHTLLSLKSAVSSLPNTVKITFFPHLSLKSSE